MDVYSVVGLSVITALLAMTVKSFRPELGIQVGIAGGLIVLSAAAAELTGIIRVLNEQTARMGLDGDVIRFVIKVTGIAYATGFAADICRDAGENAIASRMEICGRLMLFSAALPKLVSLFSLICGLIEEYL